ncbi:hypothetical protein K7G98_11055 [Saccharothrix sp. MB29]|nr:hypothetical protein [Saccharothrix sp. MB29]
MIAGVTSRRAQPRNRIGVLLVLVGASWWLDYTTVVTDPLPLVLVAKVRPAVLGHAVVAFPPAGCAPFPGGSWSPPGTPRRRR